LEMAISIEQDDILFSIRIVCSSISFICSVLVVLCFVWFLKKASPKRTCGSSGILPAGNDLKLNSMIFTNEGGTKMSKYQFYCNENKWSLDWNPAQSRWEMEAPNEEFWLNSESCGNYPLLDVSTSWACTHDGVTYSQKFMFTMILPPGDNLYMTMTKPSAIVINRGGTYINDGGTSYSKYGFFKDIDPSLRIRYVEVEDQSRWELNTSDGIVYGNSKSDEYYPSLDDVTTWTDINDPTITEEVTLILLTPPIAFHLISYVAVSEMLACSGRLFGNSGSYDWCRFQSFQTNMFDLCKFFWVASVSNVINYARCSTTFDGEIYIRRCHMIIWPSAFTISLLPFTTDSYGTAGGWWWIKKDDFADELWQIAAYYGELVLVFGYLLYVYIKKYLSYASVVSGSKDPKKVIYVPLVLLVTYFFGLFRHVFEIFGGETPFWLAFLDIALSSLFGFGIGVIYCVINYEFRNDQRVLYQ